MPCEKYQHALIDLAAQGADPTGDLRSHLAACTSCRSYFEQEQFLLASINTTVRTGVNAALPAALVQRLQARLAQEPSPQRRAFRAWALAAAGCAVLATASVLGLRSVHRLPFHVKSESTVANSARGPEFPPVSSVPARTSEAPLPVSIASRMAHHILPEVSRQTTGNEYEPEVLVPSDEREALARFVNGLHGQPEIAEAFLVHASERSESPFPLPLIQIARLEIPSLEPSDDRESTTSEK
jgi:hypothetical protein